MKKSIVWLASYPKSGNTWVRIFLANYLMNGAKPVPINEVHKFMIGDVSAVMYRQVARGKPLDTSDPVQVTHLRDGVLRGIVGNNADVNMVKTHNIRDKACDVELIPAKYTRSSIYIVRNPLDMILSYARHHSISLDESVDAISRSDNVTLGDERGVITFMGSWSEHVDSWMAPAPYPQLLLRYEDMLTDPETSFGKVIAHIGLPQDPARLRKAIEFSSFKEVSRQESETGFREKSQFADRFFSVGQSGQWRDKLPPEHVDRITRDHGATMKRLGYLE